MKRSAMDHPKLLMLQHELGLNKPAAVGILECLWHFTANYTPDGRIGKYPAALVAERMGYDKDPSALFQALETCGWLDRTDAGWLIHDWAEHCEDAVHMRLARAAKRFADGSMPRLTRLSTKERKAVLARYHDQQRDLCAQGRGRSQPPSVMTGTPRDKQTQQDAASNVEAASSRFLAESLTQRHERTRQDAASTFLCAHAVRTADALAEADAEACANAEADAYACANAEADADAERAVGSVGSAEMSAKLSARAAANPSASISAERHEFPRKDTPGDGCPVSAAELLPKLMVQFQARREELPDRIVRATGDAPPYREWWRRVCGLMLRHDGADTLREALHHVEDCASPKVRAAKDLGELRAPGAFLASRCRDHLARHGLRLPPPPQRGSGFQPLSV